MGLPVLLRSDLGLELTSGALSSVARAPSLVRSKLWLGRRLQSEGASAVEERPELPVSKALVVEHELTNRVRKMRALPLTLRPPRLVSHVGRCGCTNRPDRVGRTTEFMVGHMGSGASVPSAARGLAGSAAGPAVATAHMADHELGGA